MYGHSWTWPENDILIKLMKSFMKLWASNCPFAIFIHLNSSRFLQLKSCLKFPPRTLCCNRMSTLIKITLWHKYLAHISRSFTYKDASCRFQEIATYVENACGCWSCLQFTNHIGACFVTWWTIEFRCFRILTWFLTK